MSLGQSALAAMALVVITFLVVSANRIIIQSRQDELKGEAYNQAGEIANDLINEALKKKFDDPQVLHYFWYSGIKYYYNYGDGHNVYEDTTQLTPVNKLGATSPVTPPAEHGPIGTKFLSIGYDDFDDYNGYQRIVDTPTMTGFVVNCTVSYYSPYTKTPVNYPTYMKILTVTVSQPIYLPDALTFKATMAYGD
jgi:hypothetical protein